MKKKFLAIFLLSLSLNLYAEIQSVVFCSEGMNKAEAIKALNFELSAENNKNLNNVLFDQAGSGRLTKFLDPLIVAVSSVTFIDDAKSEGYHSNVAACVTVVAKM
ncbi:MAG: hypothetical protein A2381_06205 [Bdellovibrionales bacterium RIFOXYB1_FULL_37_110]|nr:MAG: hypothetical protein A2417_02480 [Bdellovibrionales bacterium RIFOXYC1_FULL_37_79]OFZ60098.1 MAG: hypothetical protein A2381_06205 [Bdellovibrionales bacterium RIFOXYB1_FULL_37_110]